MVIHFLKEDCLTALKANVAGNLKHYSEPTNDWVYDFFDGENPFQEYKYQIDDFEFDTVTNNDHSQGFQDVENIIRLYSAMKNITDTQATDERLWAGLSHGDFWSYMNIRWCSFNEQASNVSSRYFLGTGSGLRRSLFVNTISRLWWAGRLTYDESRDDPFELTRSLSKFYSARNLVLFSSSYINSRSVMRGLLSALMILDEEGYTKSCSSSDCLISATKYLNIIGGSHILDYYTEDEIRDKVLNYMHKNI